MFEHFRVIVFSYLSQMISMFVVVDRSRVYYPSSLTGMRLGSKRQLNSVD